jgi:catechol 2,3-dioxygenase-like lactoylglutathione lyase family enzyme
MESNKSHWPHKATRTREEGHMHTVGLDHLVLNAKDVERMIAFYRDILGLEILRLKEFHEGQVGFVSVRISPETIIDIRPIDAEAALTPNVDHYCLVLGPTDMQQLHATLQAQGVRVEAAVRPAWGAQGYGEQFKLWDPEGNKIELRCYAAPSLS